MESKKHDKTLSFYYPRHFQHIEPAFPGDIIIFHSGLEFKVSSFILCHHSKRALREIIEDCTVNKIIVTSQGGSFGLIVDFLKQGIIDFKPENFMFIYSISCELEIVDLIEKASRYIVSSCSLNDCVQAYILGFEFGAELSIISTFLAKKLSDCITNGLLDYLNDEMLDFLLSNPFVTCNIEQYNRFIMNRINLKSINCTRLVKHLPFSDVSVERVNEIVFHPQFNMNRVRNLLLMEQISPNQKKQLSYSYNDQAPLNGIITNLKIAKVSSSPIAKEGYEPNNLLPPFQEKYFCSLDGSSPWLIFDFYPIEIQLFGIELQSWKFASNGVAPIHFTVEGSLGGNQWDLIDDVNSYSLVDNSAIGYFPVNTVLSYSYFRITQISNANPGNLRFALQRAEFYGILQ